VPGERFDVVVFEVHGRQYALPAGQVRELVRAVALVPLPGAPAVVEGMFNLRGKVVPVLDVRGRFGLPPRALDPADHFVVAWANNVLVALRADRALGLIRLEGDQVEQARGLAPGVDYVRWVARLPDNLVLIHDLASVLSRAESHELEGALEAGPPPTA
jgi:purine-binding chemotaxis protein CheW